MSSSGNVVKLKKRKQINIGTVIFIFIVLYISASVIYASNKEKISIYEVQEANLARNLTVTGVITREEQIYYSEAAGYINYYLQDGRRMKKEATVYSIDANRSVYDLLGTAGEIELTEDDMSEIKRMIAAFSSTYTGEDFSSVYNLKESVMLKAVELSDWNLLESMQDIAANTGITSSFQFVKSDCSGLISYTSDSLDGLTPNMVNAATFQTENFTSSSLRTHELLSAGAPVYKVITSDQWQIVCPVTMEQYIGLQERTKLNFTITKDDFTFSAPVEFSLRGSEYYMTISLSRYAANYLKDRFLTLEINLTEDKGLKIPVSSILTKEFYLVPEEYFIQGGDSVDLGLNVVTYNTQTGEPEYEFVKTEIYYQDDTYAYIDKSLFSAGTMIYCATTGEVLQIGMTGSLEGVYCVNRGYALFRRIERIEENDSYVIIKRGTSGGLSAYDHIALNADNVVESSVIY